MFQSSDFFYIADFMNFSVDNPPQVFSVADIDCELRRLLNNTHNNNDNCGADELPPWNFRSLSFAFSSALTFYKSLRKASHLALYLPL